MQRTNIEIKYTSNAVVNTVTTTPILQITHYQFLFNRLVLMPGFPTEPEGITVIMSSIHLLGAPRSV